MNQRFFQQLQRLSREDEARSRILMHGIKQILEEKKEGRRLVRMFRKKSRIEPRAWN